MNIFKSTLCLCILAGTTALAYAANDTISTDTEIAELINLVASSGCTFYRNGDSHAAEEAADHLRLKLRHGAKYAKTTEGFIENLASQSSWSRKPYYIECDDETKVIMNSWLNNQLQAIRSH